MSINCRGTGGIPLSNINKKKDLTTQVDGITDTFDVGESFTNLRVFYNGINESGNVIDEIGTTFQLDFVPRKIYPTKVWILYIIYDKIK